LRVNKRGAFKASKKQGFWTLKKGEPQAIKLTAFCLAEYRRIMDGLRGSFVRQDKMV
jgi:hypothetical protein